MEEKKSIVKYITKKYNKGICYSKEEMGEYKNNNIHRNELLKKWSIVITPSI